MNFRRHRSGLFSPGEKPHFGEAVLNRQHPFAQGLLASWLFNEQTGTTAFDAVKSLPLITTNGSPGWNVHGIDLVNTRLGCNDTYLQPNYISIEAIFKADIDDSTVWEEIATNRLSSDDPWNSYSINRVQTNDSIGFSITNYLGAGHQTTINAGNNTWIANVWFHVVGTFDGNNMRLFLDGKLVAGPTVKTGTIVYNQNYGFLVGATSSLSEDFDGTLKLLRIWNRALTAGEIARLFAEPYEMFIAANPVHYFYIVSAGAPLEISVNQSIAVTEVRSGLFNVLLINKFENLRVSELRTVASNLAGISKIENVALIESTIRNLPLGSVVKYDNISVTEYRDQLAPLAGVSLQDMIALIEYRDQSMPLGSISIFDGIGSAESIGESVPLGQLLGFDALTVGEVLSILRDLVPSLFDGISVSEFIQILAAEFGVTVSESIRLSEYIDAVMAGLEASIADRVVLSEVVQAAIELLAQRDESITVAESIATILQLLANISQNVAVTEYVQAVLEGLLSGINKTEIIALAEWLQAELETVLGQISILESMVILESAQGILSSGPISISQMLSIAEAITAQIPLALNASDLIAISQYISVLLPSGALVIDTIRLSESIAAQFDHVVLTRVENLKVSEYVSIIVTGFAGIVTASIEGIRPKLTFIAKRPKIIFAKR